MCVLPYKESKEQKHDTHNLMTFSMTFLSLVPSVTDHLLTILIKQVLKTHLVALNDVITNGCYMMTSLFLHFILSIFNVIR